MKRAFSVFAAGVLVVSLAGSGIAGAQDNPPPPAPMGQEGRFGQGGRFGEGGRFGDRGRAAFDVARTLIDVIVDETGLLPREVVLQVSQGSTLADIITANGGDVQVVSDAAVAAITAAVEQAVADGAVAAERAEQLLLNLPQLVEQGLNGDLRGQQRGLDRGRIVQRAERALMQAVTEATGLDVGEVMSQLREGTTLAEIITASGGDVEAVITDTLAALNERIESALADGRITAEQAETLRTQIEAGLRERMTMDVWAQGAVRAASVSVLRLAVEQTGLSAPELREALQGGATLADVLTENGVSVEAFVADAVARLGARLNVQVVDGRMTQERADELLAEFQARLMEQVNQPWDGIGRQAGVGV